MCEERHSVSIVVPDAPRGKGRPRFVRATGRTYTDDKTVMYENLIKTIWLTEIGRKMTGEIEVAIDLVYPIPKSKPKRVREDMTANMVRPVCKPDADNCAKAILDGLQGVAFDGDEQVVDLTVHKYYGEPCARVTVTGAINLPRRADYDTGSINMSATDLKPVRTDLNGGNGYD